MDEVEMRQALVELVEYESKRARLIERLDDDEVFNRCLKAAREALARGEDFAQTMIDTALGED